MSQKNRAGIDNTALDADVIISYNKTHLITVCNRYYTINQEKEAIIGELSSSIKTRVPSAEHATSFAPANTFFHLILVGVPSFL